MGQMSIPALNKVGYSMYWNSMWDNKVSYTRSLKEDLYLNKYIDLLFDDKISAKILNANRKNKFNVRIIKKYIPHSREKYLNNNLINYLKKNNKIIHLTSKLWVFKYQKWVVLFCFLYLPIFNNIKKKKIIVKKNYVYDSNPYNLLYIYKKASLKFKYSYNFFKKKAPNFIF